MRVTGPMLRPDAPIRGRMSVSSRDHFYEYEQGRLAALRGENLDALPYVPPHQTNYWLNGWRAGTRQRLYREACMDAKTQQLLELVTLGWKQREIARALRIGKSSLCNYLHGKHCSRDLAERINTLYGEVKKAEAWLEELSAEPPNKRVYEPSTEARGNGPTVAQ